MLLSLIFVFRMKIKLVFVMVGSCLLENLLVVFVLVKICLFVNPNPTLSSSHIIVVLMPKKTLKLKNIS